MSEVVNDGKIRRHEQPPYSTARICSEHNVTYLPPLSLYEVSAELLSIREEHDAGH